MTGIIESAAAYVEPDESEFRTAAEIIELEGSLDGYRLGKIALGVASYEPRQEGIHRYPPVQVEVNRDPERIKGYIDMEPTDGSVWAAGHSPENT